MSPPNRKSSTTNGHNRAVDLDEIDAVAALTESEARDLTDRICRGLDGVWGLVKQAYLGRAWVALGYESWDVYCIQEFDSHRLRVPREDRSEVVHSLRQAGLSYSAISSATGDSV